MQHVSDRMHKKSKTYTVMFIPDDNGKPFSFRLSKAIVHSVAFFLFVFVAGLTVLLFRAGEIGLRLQLVHTLKEENLKLQEQNDKLMVLAKKLHSMERISQYLRRLASAIGEGEAGSAALGAGTGGDEHIFGEDSLDSFLEEVRAAESEQYRHLAEIDATPELLLGSIPNIRPAEGWLTKRFNIDRDDGEYHPGVDFAAAHGSLIRASAPGTVDKVYNDKYFGLMVAVQHSFGFETRYGHCSQVLVSEGDVVERGQALALVGNTGRSSGPHLHYEVLRNGKYVDPMKYLLSQAMSP